MTLKEHIIKFISKIDNFVETNRTYHYILIISTIYLIAHGIPMMIETILGDDFDK